MFKKTRMLAAAAAMALAMIATGCSGVEESTLVMDSSNEKMIVIAMENANEDDFVQGGYIDVAENEEIEVVSELNDKGKIAIDFIAVEENQDMEELPDTTEAQFQMVISGNAIQTVTADPGQYDLRVTVQGKATGEVTINVKPTAGAVDEAAADEATADEATDDEVAANDAAADEATTAEGGHTNWTQAATAEEACAGAGLDSLADLNGTKISLGVLGEMGPITYRYMDGVAQIFCPAAAVEMSVIKGHNPSGVDGDVSLDSTPYQHEWTQDVDGQEVKCFGNRDGEATKTIWTAGDYNYAVVAYGAGGDDDFGLSAEDVAIMVKAVK